MAKVASNEMFVRKKGKKTDGALQGEILDNREADEVLSSAAVRRAVERGLSPASARKIYGI